MRLLEKTGSTLRRSSAAVALIGASLTAPAPATAQQNVVFEVTVEQDGVDAAPGDGTCATAAGDCTLRAAVQEANLSTSYVRIRLGTGDYQLTIAGAGEDNAATGDLDIKNPDNGVEIDGRGDMDTIITSDTDDRIFHIIGAPDSLGLVAITDLRMRGGMLTDHGGNVLVGPDGFFLASQLVIMENEPFTPVPGAATGGGIAVRGAHAVANIADSEIIENYACHGAGASVDEGGFLDLNNVTIAQNLASTPNASTCGGGGIYVGPDGGLALTSSTVSGNEAEDRGGGILTENGIQLYGVTITTNLAPDGSGIHHTKRPVGELTTSETIIAGNFDGPQCAGDRMDIFRGNLDGGDTCFNGTKNITNADPQLGELSRNGGFGRTHALPKNSPAVDAQGGNCIAEHDQRDVRRGWDGDGDGSRGCDYGSFELVPPVKRKVSLSLSSHLRASGEITLPNSAGDDKFICGPKATVEIQRKVNGSFKTIADVKSTSASGGFPYSVQLPDKTGTYRALVRSKAPATQTRTPEIYDCQTAKSATKGHQH